MQERTFRVLLGVALVSSSAAIAGPCDAGSPIIIGKRIPASQRTPVAEINHDAWDALLREYVDPAGMVDYQAWKSSVADRQALRAYLRHLSSASDDKAIPRVDRLAFWINAYNALTIEGILREYPTSSIRNHTAKFFGYNIWKDLQLWVGDEAYSLDAMEHDVLRKMGEPRIHFAIVCASVGCPKLRSEAYTPEKVEDQLASNAEAFFRDPTKLQYDVQRKMIALSPILDWFGEDFGGDQAEQLRSIAPFLPDAASRRLAKSATVRVKFLEYDWGLNDRARLRRTFRR